LDTSVVTRTLTTDEYTRLCVSTLTSHGVEIDLAEAVVEALMWCDLHGISSHGANMLPTYIKRVQLGGIARNKRPVVMKEYGATASIDGQGGFGQVTAFFAADQAVRVAQQHGVGVVSVHRCNHVGALGCYNERIARAGYIGFIVTNANPTVAPFGGRAPALGTNPISFGFPGKDIPVIVDLATSATAKGKIYELARKSDTIPARLALNKNGDPTTSAAEALKGILLPLGGPKGYSLAVAVEILSGVLANGKVSKDIDSFHGSPDKPQDVSLFVMALQIEAFLTPQEYQAGLAGLTGYLESTPTCEGFDKVCLPGEHEAALAALRREKGIPMLEMLYQEISSYISLNPLAVS